MITKEQIRLLEELAPRDFIDSTEEAAIRAALDALNAQAVPVAYQYRFIDGYAVWTEWMHCNVEEFNKINDKRYVMYSGQKARAEARELYAAPPAARELTDEEKAERYAQWCTDGTPFREKCAWNDGFDAARALLAAKA